MRNDNWQIILIKPPLKGWVKVSKKKGKKCGLEDEPLFE